MADISKLPGVTQAWQKKPLKTVHKKLRIRKRIIEIKIPGMMKIYTKVKRILMSMFDNKLYTQVKV